MNKSRLIQVASLLACLLMMVAVAITHDHKILGYKIGRTDKDTAAKTPLIRTPERTADDGTLIINTSTLGKDIKGYGGTVPLEISIRNGKVERITALKNAETPEFFKRACDGLLTAWNGQKVEDALNMEVDGVTGATFSSRAIIGNVKAGLAYAKKSQIQAPTAGGFRMTAKFALGLIVVLMAALLPLKIHNKRYHNIQMVLNVAVLGLWCGYFVSYSQMVGHLANGIDLLPNLVVVVMLITAFLYPLFGKKQYYCTNVCPFGSLQQLAGQWTRHKLPMSNRTIQYLEYARQGLWALLMICLWTGLLTEWMDYELFTAFIFQSAANAVMVLAVAFVLLSIVVPRPYCRFVCPTGTLMKTAEMSK
jgi:NosR/NirI family nitrous oxide reductase transcriptional regulator